MIGSNFQTQNPTNFNVKLLKYLPVTRLIKETIREYPIQ